MTKARRAEAEVAGSRAPGEVRQAVTGGIVA
jgi:hypothetical protein